MADSTTVNTKKAPHREINFASVEELSAELDRAQRAHDGGTLQTTGNWSAGQIFQHIANVYRMGLDGVEFKPPLLVRLIFKPLRGWALKGKPPKGIKLRGGSAALAPDDNVAFDAGMSDLRGIIKRLNDGEQMTHPSPLLGPMTHEQWTKLQLNHAAMHLGFLRYDAGN